MDFEQLTKVRQSCRSYDADRPVAEEKNAISHRGNATKLLIDELKSRGLI